MLGNMFYFSFFKKYIDLFGKIFADITITRIDKNGNVNAVIRVPITFAPKEKMLARVNQDPGIDRQTALPTMPLMSFEMTGLKYAADRKLPTTGRNYAASSDPNKLSYQYNSVPYDIGFRLYVLTKNYEDSFKIIEQILPYFTPAFSPSVEIETEMGITKSVPINLNSIEQVDTYDGDFEKRQHIIWTLDFTLYGEFYGPIITKTAIKYANIEFFAGNTTNSSEVGYIAVQPGLDANGNPTSSANLSIDTNLIKATDNYRYIVTIGDFSSEE